MFRTATVWLFSFCLLHCAAAQPSSDDNPSESGNARVSQWLKMDGDGDGRLSKQETSGLMQRFFDRNDTNSDGYLDRKELVALDGRLARRQSPGNQSNNRRQGMSTAQLLKTAPKNVVITPDVAYREGSSEAWRLDLVEPKEKSNSPRAGIVFVHGGGWRSGDKRTGTFLRGAIEYAQKGYVCITINYRLTGEAPLPACIEDVKCAVRWFRAHAQKYNVDPNRIGGYGNSAGAHLVSMLGLCKPGEGLEGDGPYQDHSSLLQAVCASATPSDFGLFPDRGDRRFGETGEQRKQMLRKCSPVTHVGDAAPPFLLIHGTADRTVTVKHGDVLAEKLKAAGADVTYLRIDDAGHGVFNQHAESTKPAMEAFFARTIGKED